MIGVDKAEAREIAENYLEILRATLRGSVLTAKGIEAFIDGFHEAAKSVGAKESDPVTITLGKNIIYDATPDAENSHKEKLTQSAIKAIKTAVLAPQSNQEKVSIAVGDKEFYAVSNEGEITRDDLNLHPHQAQQQIPQSALEQMSESMARVSAALAGENTMSSMSARIAILEESHSQMVQTVQQHQAILEHLLSQSKAAANAKAPGVQNSKLGNYLRRAANTLNEAGSHTDGAVDKIRRFGQWVGGKALGAIQGLKNMRDSALVSAATTMLSCVGDKHPDGSRTFTTDSSLHFERTPDGLINIARGARSVMKANQLSPQATSDDLKELNKTRDLAEEINQIQSLEQKKPSTALSR